MMDTAQAIEPSFVKRVLAPYQPMNTDYLRAARVTHIFDAHDTANAKGEEAPVITAEGDYSIPLSCYIQSTGHFNAVEFLICFNQLAYTTCGYLVCNQIMRGLPEGRISAKAQAKFAAISEEDFFTNQLGSMLILKTETRFKNILDASNFRAKFSIKSIFCRNDTLFLKSNCQFTDGKGGQADGDVLLAYVRN